MNNQRWVTSIHEAAHAIAALAQDGDCSGILLTGGGGGLARVSGLYGSPEVFMVAAGPAAEYLADEHPAPSTPHHNKIGTTEPLPPSVDLAFSIAVELADEPALTRECVTDDRTIALWSIDGREDDPDAWAGRVRFAKHVANKIIEANAAEIIRVAERLFVEGHVTGEQIKTIFTDSKVEK